MINTHLLICLRCYNAPCVCAEGPVFPEAKPTADQLNQRIHALAAEVHALREELASTVAEVGRLSGVMSRYDMDDLK